MEEPCAIYVGRKFNVGAIGRVVVRFRRRRIGGRRGERREEKSKGMKKLKVEFGCIC
ncbi:hypothetical protein AAZX31_13G025700 [Glycine max]